MFLLSYFEKDISQLWYFYSLDIRRGRGGGVYASSHSTVTHFYFVVINVSVLWRKGMQKKREFDSQSATIMENLNSELERDIRLVIAVKSDN